jgi:hypothetical protein
MIGFSIKWHTHKAFFAPLWVFEAQSPDGEDGLAAMAQVPIRVKYLHVL